MKTKIICLLAIFTFFEASAQAPGGIADTEMWSKIIKNPLPATTFQYKNFSKNNKTITVGASATLTPSLFNYNYSYTYSATSFVSFVSKLETMKDATIFIVHKPAQTGQLALMNSNWNAIVPPVGINEQAFSFSTDNVIKNVNPAVSYPAPGAVRLNARINTIVWHNFRSKNIVNSYGANGESSIFVGRNFTGAANFIGDIPEFIVYRKALNKGEKLRVESYLAIKYGITLFKEENYINSKSEIYWHKENNTIFKNRIFGIGRDNNTTLYQRQSASAHDASKLIFWTGNLLANNYLNTANLEDQSNLTIGDNSGNEIPNTVLNNGIKKIDRTWLVEKFGDGMHNLTTGLKYKKDASITLLPNEAFWLIIDRDADNLTTSTFNGSNLEYYQVTSFDASGYAQFNNIRWASVSTIYNQFTFGVGPKMVLVPTLTANDCLSQSLNVVIKGGVPPFTVNIHGTDNTYNNQFNTLNYTISQLLNNGNYLVSVTDATSYLVQTPIVIDPVPGIAVNLGPDFTYGSATTYTLDAGATVTSTNVTYAWTKNGIIEPITTATYVITTAPVTTPDIYECTITNTVNGCTISDSIKVSPAPLLRLGEYAVVYPNPSRGQFTLEIKFDKIKNIEVTLTDIAGKILLTDLDNGNNFYKKDYSLLVAGIYFVNIKADDYTKTIKIIIN